MAIQSPFLIDGGTIGLDIEDLGEGTSAVNYLLKIKKDIADFSTKSMSKYFHFVPESSGRLDPFLISASMTQ